MKKIIGISLLLISFVLPGIGTGHPAVLKKDFIYTEAPFPECHASTIVEVKPGLLLAAWFGGKEEADPSVGIWMSRYEDSKWSTPVEIAKHDRVPCYNPVLFQKPGGETILFYKAGPSPDQWSGYIKRSSDEGKTWTKDEDLPAGILGPIKNKPVLLKDGSLLCPSSVESWKAWACWMEITKDWGKTWQKAGPIAYPGVTKGLIQPTLFSGKDGNIKMLCRATDTIGSICIASSTDSGKTWSEVQKTSLPNPNSGIDAVSLKDNRTLLIYNHTQKGRSPINVGISKDDGNTWENVITLESQPGEYSYPAVIQASDGKVHVTYTWKRKRIQHVILDPEKIQ